jgi:hypothetical protein
VNSAYSWQVRGGLHIVLATTIDGAQLLIDRKPVATFLAQILRFAATANLYAPCEKNFRGTCFAVRSFVAIGSGLKIAYALVQLMHEVHSNAASSRPAASALQAGRIGLCRIAIYQVAKERMASRSRLLCDTCTRERFRRWRTDWRDFLHLAGRLRLASAVARTAWRRRSRHSIAE